MMDEEKFQHMLKLSAIYIPVLRSREFFQGIDEMEEADRHNILNCLEIVADTFVEMQRRLGVKPKFRIKQPSLIGHNGGPALNPKTQTPTLGMSGVSVGEKED